MKNLSVKLPDVGEGVTEAELSEWHVKVGDVVREDDIVVAVMTDKATVEIPSLYSGRIVKLGGDIGDILPVGSELVLIETDGEIDREGVPAKSEAGKEQKPQVEVKDSAVSGRQASLRELDPGHTPPRGENAQVLASPAVRARARATGLDLRQVAGSGPSGRITDADLDLVFERSSQSVGGTKKTARSKGRETEEIKVTGMRRRIAEHMALANERIAHITVVEEVNVSALEQLRAQINADCGKKPKLTLLPFFVSVLAKAVSEHPEMNAHYDDEAGVIRRFADANVGVATMTDAGLVVPVLRHAGSLGIFELSAEITRLSEEARAGKIKREKLTGSTITLTSLGPLGAFATTPIINHPEVAILGINKIAVRPEWDGTRFIPCRMMNVSASFDHRVIDGWNAAVFVQKIKSLIETPALIFLDD